MTKTEFIYEIEYASSLLFDKYKIPISVVIAQACLESGFGRFDLGVHNLFGIKGTGPNGSVIKKTQEFDKKTQSYITIDAKFRSYHDYKECIDDHMRNLSTNKAYKKARMHLDDYEQFANCLTGVYATDPNYGSKLLRIIKHFDLTKYDKKQNNVGG